MRVLIFAVATAVALSACADMENVRSVAPGAMRRVVDKNYTLGQERVAYVGQPVVRVRDYYVEDLRAFNSSVAFSATWLNQANVNYPVGTQAEVMALADYDNVTYSIASVTSPSPGSASLQLLVDPSNRYEGMMLTSDGIVESCDETVCIAPNVIDFAPSKVERIVTKSSFTNFEIVYSGATKDTISLLYREYTPDDMVRPAFTQNLTYDRASSSIRFREVQVKVVEAGNESLRYVVEADGLKR